MTRVVAFGLIVAVWLGTGWLTTLGARRRGQRWRTAWLNVPFFPLTWVLWYVIDERAAGGRATRQLRRQGR